MCFPLFKQTETGYKLQGVYLDLDAAMEKCKELGPEYHWEPWPTDALFNEYFG